MSLRYELETQFSSQKSFYKKAFVFENLDGYKILESYGTPVATIDNGKAYIFNGYSQTTLKHIKEFLLQNGFKAENKKQMLNDYQNNETK